MAKSVLITTKENGTQIIIDGNKINDVISYELRENWDERTLSLEIAIRGEIEVHR